MASYINPLLQTQLNLLRQTGVLPSNDIIYPGMPGSSTNPISWASNGMGGITVNPNANPILNTGPFTGGGGIVTMDVNNGQTDMFNPNPDPMPLNPNGGINFGNPILPGLPTRPPVVITATGTGLSNQPVTTTGNSTSVPFNDYSSTSEGYWQSFPDGTTRFIRYGTDVITTGGGNTNTGGGSNGGGNTGGGNNVVVNNPMPLPPSNSRIYTRINFQNDKVEENGQIITRGIWGNNGDDCSLVTGSMYNFYTGSYQTTKQKEYWYDVVISPNNKKCDVEFSVSYGHWQGSGSYSGGGQLNDSPSRSIYSQMVLVTDSLNDTGKFIDQDGISMDDIYIISISKDRMRDKLDPGNWELNLSELNGNNFANNVYTGSNVQISGSGKIISLIDDSLDTDETISTGGLVQHSYKIYSGSIVNGIHSTGSHYGYMYPNLGLIVLNGSLLNSELSFNTYSSSNSNGDNAYKLFTSISGSATPTGSRTLLYPFDARNVKIKTTTHYFLRVKSYEYNYSNNPTFRSGSEGEFKHPTFVRDPKTFITTIGLYNDNYDLLATAKLSKPILKSFTNEANVTVKLEY
jgi:hypothetical protein